MQERERDVERSNDDTADEQEESFYLFQGDLD
jgi:hypothetical protein